jgi:hypothetical protein
MPALHGEALLSAWERCQGQPEPVRALALLQAAQPERPWASLAALPLAERNRELLELRAATFGRQLEGFAQCERCGTALEFSLDTRQLSDGMRAVESDEWTDGDRAYRMRPANTEDLLAALRAGDGAEEMLLARTVEKVSGEELATLQDGSPRQRNLGLSVSKQNLAERFEALNAPAEIQLAVQCASCGERSQVDLDIAAFLGGETSRAARRLFKEIHRLAAAYGWSEQSILAMSDTRRRAYMAILDA